MNYKIIKDPQKLKEFIEWLPQLEDGEVFYVMLKARDKYFKNLGTQSVKLKRFTSNKENLFNKIEQLQVELGCYQHKGQPIPNDALCLSIMPNPRSQVKIAKYLTKLLIDLVFNNYNGYNVHQEALTSLQKTPSTIRYMDFDFDNTSIEDMKDKIYEVINKDCLTFVQTRGGFHLLVEVAKVAPEFKKNYYNNIKKLPFIDKDSKPDTLLPCPGCSQGDFTPKLFKF